MRTREPVADRHHPHSQRHRSDRVRLSAAADTTAAPLEMGLLKHLLFWPVTGPLFLAEFSLGKVQGVVREELTDDTRIKAELMELQLKLELGDIDDDEYVAAEAALMRQLRDVRHWREQFGMGVSGGPVRVQAADREEVVPDASADVVDEDGARAAAAEESADDRAPRVADPHGGADVEIRLDWD